MLVLLVFCVSMVSTVCFAVSDCSSYEMCETEQETDNSVHMHISCHHNHFPAVILDNFSKFQSASKDKYVLDAGSYHISFFLSAVERPPRLYLFA